MAGNERPGLLARPLVYRGAREICAVIGEDPRRLLFLVERENLPAWRREGESLWRALPEDLERWLKEQRGKYLAG